MFYDTLNSILKDARFDPFVEELCLPYYAAGGRRSIPPGRYFRMLLVGFFEDIGSQRGIAWRCVDSLSLRAFLFLAPDEEAPDHSSLTRIRDRLPLDVYEAVFQFVLRVVDEHGLLRGRTVGVDATTLEANAAMKSIVRKDSGADWNAYLRELASAEGVEINNDEDLRRFDRKRSREGKKRVSNVQRRVGISERSGQPHPENERWPHAAGLQTGAGGRPGHRSGAGRDGASWHRC